MNPGALPDMYGQGELINDFEKQVAELLGKPAAVFMPSGTMAQQIALRIHADRLHTPHVAFHPTCHLEIHEQKGYQVLHGLHSVLVGSPQRLMAIDDLKAIKEPLAALLLELPQREIGGVLRREGRREIGDGLIQEERDGIRLARGSKTADDEVSGVSEKSESRRELGVDDVSLRECPSQPGVPRLAEDVVEHDRRVEFRRTPGDRSAARRRGASPGRANTQSQPRSSLPFPQSCPVPANSAEQRGPRDLRHGRSFPGNDIRPCYRIHGL